LRAAASTAVAPAATGKQACPVDVDGRFDDERTDNDEQEQCAGDEEVCMPSEGEEARDLSPLARDRVEARNGLCNRTVDEEVHHADDAQPKRELAVAVRAEELGEHGEREQARDERGELRPGDPQELRAQRRKAPGKRSGSSSGPGGAGRLDADGPMKRGCVVVVGLGWNHVAVASRPTQGTLGPASIVRRRIRVNVHKRQVSLARIRDQLDKGNGRAERSSILPRDAEGCVSEAIST